MYQDSMEELPNISTLAINPQLRGDSFEINNFNNTLYNHTEHDFPKTTTTTIVVTTLVIISFLAGIYYITSKSIPSFKP